MPCSPLTSMPVKMCVCVILRTAVTFNSHMMLHSWIRLPIFNFLANCITIFLSIFLSTSLSYILSRFIWIFNFIHLSFSLQVALPLLISVSSPLWYDWFLSMFVCLCVWMGFVGKMYDMTNDLKVAMSVCYYITTVVTVLSMNGHPVQTVRTLFGLPLTNIL